MNVMPFLEVNGTLHSGRKQQWFQLPESGLAARSLRFGKHVLLADKTMQILPMGEKPALQPERQHQLESQISWLGNWLVNLVMKEKAFRQRRIRL